MNLSMNPKFVRLFSASVLVLLVLSGIVFRSAQYFHNRSLWLDEAFVAREVIDKSLLAPLEYQVMPTGFLLVERVNVRLFGIHERVLRLLPFLTGILAVLVFSVLATQFQNWWGAATSIGLFSGAGRLIYYSNEVKPYGVEVFFVALLLWLTLQIQEKGWKRGWMLSFMIASSLSVWFSYAIVFYLASIGLVFLLPALMKRQWKTAGLHVLYHLPWVTSLGIMLLGVYNPMGEERLLRHWAEYFMPFPPTSADEWGWFVNAHNRFFTRTMGLPFVFLPGLLLGLGFLFHFRNKPWQAIHLVLPITLALTASGLEIYPFGDRLSVFLTPSVILLIGFAVGHIGATSGKGTYVVRAALLLLLLVPVLWSACFEIMKPNMGEHSRPIFEMLQENWKAGDTLYVYKGAFPAYEYYQRRLDLDMAPVIRGSGSQPKGIARDYAKVRQHDRVWAVFSHLTAGQHLQFLEMARKDGRILARHTWSGTRLYLVDFSAK